MGNEIMQLPAPLAKVILEICNGRRKLFNVTPTLTDLAGVEPAVIENIRSEIQIVLKHYNALIQVYPDMPATKQ